MITFDYKGDGVLAHDYVIKNIRNFRKFSLHFVQSLFWFSKFYANLTELAYVSMSTIINYHYEVVLLKIHKTCFKNNSSFKTGRPEGESSL